MRNYVWTQATCTYQTLRKMILLERRLLFKKFHWRKNEADKISEGYEFIQQEMESVGSLAITFRLYIVILVLFCFARFVLVSDC